MSDALIIIGVFQLCLLLLFGVVIPMLLMHWQRVSYLKAVASLGYAIIVPFILVPFVLLLAMILTGILIICC